MQSGDGGPNLKPNPNHMSDAVVESSSDAVRCNWRIEVRCSLIKSDVVSMQSDVVNRVTAYMGVWGLPLVGSRGKAAVGGQLTRFHKILFHKMRGKFCIETCIKFV